MSKGELISRICMYVSFAVVAIAVALTYAQQTARYFPVLLVGFIGGCVSTPFYYYFKAKGNTVNRYWGADVQALNNYAEMEKRHKEDRK